jgi:hypothetical protein
MFDLSSRNVFVEVGVGFFNITSSEILLVK